MNSEITQLISLVTHVNARLQGLDVTPDLDNALASFNRRIEFVEIPEGGELEDSKVLAKNPSEWLDQLVEQGVKRVRIHYTPSMESGLADHIFVAFVGGGGQWIVEVVHGTTSSLWEAGWVAALARGNRLLKAFYVRITKSWKPIENQVSTKDAKSNLLSALEEVYKFADIDEYSRHWTTNFQNAMNDLRAENPLSETNYIPRNCLTNEAEQIISACFTGWVFGGMGSWNDMAFGGEMEEEYHRVSDSLYTAICNAIVAAINSYP